MGKVLLEMKDITKRFPGVKALDHVNLQVEEGEIHALVGENGAGKSTLMNVLSGIYPYGSYEGDIIYNGEECHFAKINDSEEKGIVIIHQELALIPYMTIGENMFLGNERGKKLAIDWNETYSMADKLLEQVGLKESSRTLIKDIGVGKQQLVEIAKALAKHARLLILDEPTASLNETDSKALLDLLLQLKKEGMTSIIISHKLNEISYVADKITVIRDGATIETLDKTKDDISEARIIKGMVGRELTDRFPKRPDKKIGDVVLEVKDWTVHHPVYTERKVVDHVSLQVRKGEVVGIAGLMGAGRTELAEMIFGAVRKKSGKMIFNGKEIDPKSPREAIDLGIALVPEDRKRHGAMLGISIKNNINMPIYERNSKLSVINNKQEQEIAEKYKENMAIKTPSLNQLVKNLSGGNQQKVILGRWMAADSELIIFDEPTRGIDVGAKYEIYKLMNDLVENQGKTILMISSEMEELMGMSDRIVVLSEGNMTGELSKEEFTQEVIMTYASAARDK